MDTEKQNGIGSLHEEMSPTAEIAYLANQEDHETSKLQATRSNPWVFAWCLFAVCTTPLVSDENQASSTILGIPPVPKGLRFLFRWKLRPACRVAGRISGGAVAV